MKKLIYLSFIALSISFVSCEKEVIQPNQQDSNIFSSSRVGGDYTFNPGTNGTNDGEGITDPNNDPDISRKKGQR